MKTNMMDTCTRDFMEKGRKLLKNCDARKTKPFMTSELDMFAFEQVPQVLSRVFTKRGKTHIRAHSLTRLCLTEQIRLRLLDKMYIPSRESSKLKLRNRDKLIEPST